GVVLDRQRILLLRKALLGDAARIGYDRQAEAAGLPQIFRLLLEHGAPVVTALRRHFWRRDKARTHLEQIGLRVLPGIDAFKPRRRPLRRNVRGRNEPRRISRLDEPAPDTIE